MTLDTHDHGLPGGPPPNDGDRRSGVELARIATGELARPEDLTEAEDLALPELLEDGVTLIEWGDLILPALPADLLEVRITLGEGDDDRVLAFTAVGASWQRRLGVLGERLTEWMVG